MASDERQEKINKILELTKCTDEAASVALFDCNNDVEKAILYVLDQEHDDQEWQVRKKQKGKTVPKPEEKKVIKPVKHENVAPQKKFDKVKVDKWQKPRKVTNNRPAAPPKEKPVEKPVGDWDPVEEYGEWTGESIEILNSNASIALETCAQPVVVEEDNINFNGNQKVTLEQLKGDLFRNTAKSKLPSSSINFPFNGPVVISPNAIQKNWNPMMTQKIYSFGDAFIKRISDAYIPRDGVSAQVNTMPLDKSDINSSASVNNRPLNESFNSVENDKTSMNKGRALDEFVNLAGSEQISDSQKEVVSSMAKLNVDQNKNSCVPQSSSVQSNEVKNKEYQSNNFQNSQKMVQSHKTNVANVNDMNPVNNMNQSAAAGSQPVSTMSNLQCNMPPVIDHPYSGSHPPAGYQVMNTPNYVPHSNPSTTTGPTNNYEYDQYSMYNQQGGQQPTSHNAHRMYDYQNQEIKLNQNKNASSGSATSAPVQDHMMPAAMVHPHAAAMQHSGAAHSQQLQPHHHHPAQHHTGNSTMPPQMMTPNQNFYPYTSILLMPGAGHQQQGLNVSVSQSGPSTSQHGVNYMKNAPNSSYGGNQCVNPGYPETMIDMKYGNNPAKQNYRAAYNMQSSEQKLNGQDNFNSSSSGGNNHGSASSHYGSNNCSTMSNTNQTNSSSATAVHNPSIMYTLPQQAIIHQMHQGHRN